MSRRILTIALAIAFAFALTLSLGGCGDKNKVEDEPEDLSVEVEEVVEEEPVVEEEEEEVIEEDEEEFLDYYEAGEWPDNEFTKLIPKPEFEVEESFLTTKQYMASFEDVTMDEAKKYCEQLKAAGFDKNINIDEFTTWEEFIRSDPDFDDFTDEEIAEFVAEMEDLEMNQSYNFEADNGAGYLIDVFWMEGYSTSVTVKRADG